jgi:single-strand DNA-binding protein
MSGSINKCILVGNVGKEPEIRTLNNGNKVATFSLATSETWRDKNSGERKEKTEWHNIVIFNENLVKVAEQYVKKGTKIYVEGQLQTRKWQDQSGSDRYTTEIVLQNFRGEIQLLGSKGDGQGQAGDPGPSGEREGATRSYANTRPAAQSNAQMANSEMDDIPFTYEWR